MPFYHGKIRGPRVLVAFEGEILSDLLLLYILFSAELGVSNPFVRPTMCGYRAFVSKKAYQSGVHGHPQAPAVHYFALSARLRQDQTSPGNAGTHLGCCRRNKSSDFWRVAAGSPSQRCPTEMSTETYTQTDNHTHTCKDLLESLP